MPHRQRHEIEEFKRRALRLLEERGAGSAIRVRMVTKNPAHPLALELHRGVLLSVQRVSHLDPDSLRDEDELRITFRSEAWVRGGLELLSMNSKDLRSQEREAVISLTVPYALPMRFTKGMVRFGEADPRTQTQDAGLLPLVFIHIDFEVNPPSNGKPMGKTSER